MPMTLWTLAMLSGCVHKTSPDPSSLAQVVPDDPACAGVRDESLCAVLSAHWAATLERFPEWASKLGEHRYDDRVTDSSIEALSAFRAREADFVARLESISLPDGEPDRVTRDLLLETLRLDLQEEICASELWNVSARANALVDSHQLAEDAIIETDEDAVSLISRYRSRAAMIAVSAANLSQGASRGLVESRDSVVKVIAMLDAELSQPLELSPLLSPKDKGLSAQRSTELKEVVEAELRPALAAYRDTLRDQVLPIARTDEKIGLHALPSGDQCYRVLIHKYTTLDRTPEFLHELGLQQLAAIHDEFRTLGARVLGTSDLGEIFAKLRTDPALHFRSPDEIRAKAEEALRRAEAAVPLWFGRTPEAPCEVDVVPDYLAPYTTIAYYDPLRESGRKYGVYFVNVSDPPSRPRHEAEVLAFHESVPGHHLQIALAYEQGALPAFRRYDGATAFVEGWALYTERLADEMGLYSDDTDRLGMLSFDTWRAARLVVDTGLHAKGWTRAQAEQFMLENTPLAENNVTNEVDRYITTPGQALAYKVGQLEIKALRAEATAALGEQFDIRAFHDTILSQGAVSLPILREHIARWTAVEAASHGR